eukprot:Em0016g375a
MITRKPAPEQLPVMFLDGGCNTVTESLAALTGQLYNATMVSFGSSSPSLSDKNRFPRFYRTIPSEIQVNSLRLAIMRTFNWTRVATLHNTENVFSVSSDDFSASYNLLYPNSSTDGNNDELLISRSFTDNSSISLQQIKDNDIRIILAWMYEDQAVTTFCEAIHLGLTTNSYVWILPGWYTQGWWKNAEKDTYGRCTRKQLEEALDFAFAVDVHSYPLEHDMPTLSGHDVNTFVRAYCNYQTAFMDMVDKNSTGFPFSCSNLKPRQTSNRCSINMHSYVPFTYDAVWSMALALKRANKNLTTNFSTSLGHFNYSNAITMDAISYAMKLTNFIGISGNLAFDSTGSRTGLNALYQFRLVGPQGLCLKLITVHDPVKENYTFQNSTLIAWKGGYIPRDRISVKPVYLGKQLVKALHSLTTLSIVLVLAILFFNISTIRKPLIADSAPHINTIVIMGCLLLLITCYLLGVDSNNPPLASPDSKQRYAIICMLRLWFLTIGFTLAFGSLFGKTWQAHRVYVDSKLKHKPFKMRNFLIILSVLLLIDVTYLTVWTILWPLQQGTTIQHIPDNSELGDVEGQYEYCSCDKYNYLIGPLYIIKGFVVLFGLFLAYETRSVSYKYINDFKYVRIATYVVVIMVGICAPMSLLFAQQWFINSAYSISVLLINTACISCLLILFIPKVIFMARGKDTLLVPGDNNEEKVVTANELQLGSTDPKPPGSGVQTLKDVEDAKTSASISSESDSGVNMNIDEVVADFTAPNPENCTEGTICIS